MEYRYSVLDAILSLNPDARGGTNVRKNDDIDNCVITWKEGISEISKEDIKTEMDRLKAEYDALDYARARDVSYPSLKEFAEAYTEKEIGGDDTKWNEYVTKYNKVRTDNPKE